MYMNMNNTYITKTHIVTIYNNTNTNCNIIPT